MSGVSTTLQMFDMMSAPLYQITQGVNSMVLSLDKLSNSANQNIDLGNTLKDMNKSTMEVSNSLNQFVGHQDKINTSMNEFINTENRVAQEQNKINSSLNEFVNTQNKVTTEQNKINTTFNQYTNTQDKLNNSLIEFVQTQERVNSEQSKTNNMFNQSANAASNLTSKVIGLVKGYIGFQAIKQGISSTLGEAMKMQQQLFTIQGIMGNTDVGTAYFNNLQKKANESVFAFEDFAQNARNYMQFTKNTDTLDKLANLSERLTLVDPTQGLQGAGFALKEMMSGDGTSLKERFGFGKADIEILKASKDMGSFLNQFDSLLNKKGFTEDMLAKYNQSASAQFDNLKSNIATSMGQAGNGALEALNPVITRLNQAFSNGSFQGFFSGISTGLSIIANGVAWLSDLVTNNWSVIQPILIFLAGALLGSIIAGLWATLPPLAANVIAWLAINWPIMLAVGAIFLFIYVLTQCGVTGEQICGVIGGSFMVLFGSIYNIVALAWNIFASFAEFLGNLFNHPLYAISNLFANIWNSIVDFVGAAIDSIIGMIKEVPFLGDLVGDFSSQSLKLDIPEVPSDYWVAPKMEMKDLTNEFNYGYGKGANFANGIGNLGNSLNGLGTNGSNVDLGMWNQSQGPGNLSFGDDDKKNLKNINDKIDVSNEHLEMLKDLTTDKSISNFTTLTPTVQVTTGDIREEADINKIISSIETYMENELANSAEGVYA